MTGHYEAQTNALRDLMDFRRGFMSFVVLLKGSEGMEAGNCDGQSFVPIGNNGEIFLE